MRTRLINYTHLDACSMAMGNCYGKKCSIDTLMKAVKSGHLSLLEHAMVSFDIVCSQKVLAQLSRHRHFSFTVQSTRGCDITGNGHYKGWKKPELMPCDEWLEFLREYDEIFSKAIDISRGYNVPYEIAAYCLPLGTNVQLTMTGNLRAWFEYIKKRLCNRASEEHRQIAREIYTKLNTVYPRVFNQDVLGLCNNCKESSCSFTGKTKNPIIATLED